MSTVTFTATATDVVTGATGAKSASFTVGSSSQVPAQPAAGPWQANGLGQLTLTVSPSKAGNLVVLAIGMGGGGKVAAPCSGVSGGGVQSWQRVTGYYFTGADQLVEIWQGVVTTSGQSVITVVNASAAQEWNRLWAREYGANATGLAWQATASPSSMITKSTPSGTGATVQYPAITGSGLYVGACQSSYGTLGGAAPSGWTYTTIDSHLQVARDSSVANPAPTATSTDSGDKWAAVGALFTVTGTPVALSIVTVQSGIPAAVTGQAYTATLQAQGGSPPYSWSLAADSLPPGLSLSAVGVISGTPVTAGTSSFTVKVADSAAASATASFTITCTTAPPVAYQGGYPPNAHATYVAPAPDSKLSIAGVTGLPYVDTNVWGPVSGEVVDLTVYTVRNWTIQASMSNSSGSVTCFPNAAAANSTNGSSGISVPWGKLSYLISGWDETMPASPATTVSACYDNWVDNALVGPTGSVVTEIMAHFDFRNRGAGPWVGQNIPFGGHTVNGIVIPQTYWNLAASGNTCWFNLSDGAGNLTNMPVGALDWLQVLQWLVAHGYISASCNLTGFSLGYEICDTQGVTVDYTYNDMWWYGA